MFHVAYDLLADADLTSHEARSLKDALSWFEKNLPVPDRSRLQPRAIFWFKGDAKESARKVWELTELLGDQGRRVEMIRTSRPGALVYEDTYQVAAIPFRDTFQARTERRR